MNEMISSVLKENSAYFYYKGNHFLNNYIVDLYYTRAKLNPLLFEHVEEPGLRPFSKIERQFLDQN